MYQHLGSIKLKSFSTIESVSIFKPVSVIKYLQLSINNLFACPYDVLFVFIYNYNIDMPLNLRYIDIKYIFKDNG